MADKISSIMDSNVPTPIPEGGEGNEPDPELSQLFEEIAGGGKEPGLDNPEGSDFNLPDFPDLGNDDGPPDFPDLGNGDDPPDTEGDDINWDDPAPPGTKVDDSGNNDWIIPDENRQVLSIGNQTVYIGGENKEHVDKAIDDIEKLYQGSETFRELFESGDRPPLYINVTGEVNEKFDKNAGGFYVDSNAKNEHGNPISFVVLNSNLHGSEGVGPQYMVHELGHALGGIDDEDYGERQADSLEMEEFTAIVGEESGLYEYSDPDGNTDVPEAVASDDPYAAPPDKDKMHLIGGSKESFDNFGTYGDFKEDFHEVDIRTITKFDDGSFAFVKKGHWYRLDPNNPLVARHGEADEMNKVYEHIQGIYEKTHDENGNLNKEVAEELQNENEGGVIISGPGGLH